MDYPTPKYDGYKTHDPLLLALDALHYNWQEMQYYRRNFPYKRMEYDFNSSSFYEALKKLQRLYSEELQRSFLCSQGEEGGSSNTNSSSSM